MTTLDRYHAHPLHAFLKEFAVPSHQGQDASLCGMGIIKGRWLIPDEKYPEFLNNLNDYLFVEKGRPINLVEQPRLDTPKPLLIDLDFKFPLDTSLTHRFEPTHIYSFVKKLAEGLGTFFGLDSYKSIRFFVSLRPQAYADGKKYIKDGIHIQSPDICLTNEKQKVLRLWLLEQQAIQEAFGDIGYNNEIDDIYDESMVRKQGWFLYGESKVNIPPYALESVYAFNPKAGVIDEEDIGQFSARDLLEILSVRYNLVDDDNDVRDEQKDVYEKFLRPKAKVKADIEDVTEESEKITDSSSKTMNIYIPESHDSEEIKLAKDMVIECLSSVRADNYKTWMEVGWCLYNIDHSEEMFETWQEFSKKSTKSAGTEWGRLKNDWMRGFSRNTAGAKLTLRSLHYWAREDNLEKYKELIEEDHVRFVINYVGDTHYHVGLLLKRMYKDRFCASVESRKTEWYVFDENINSWRHTNQGMELQEKLSTEVAKLFRRAQDRLKKKAEDDYEIKKGKDKEMENVKINEKAPMPISRKKNMDWFSDWAKNNDEGLRFSTLNKIEHQLYKHEFKIGVMKAAIELFHEEDFSNRLNMNAFLFACKNGVLDLKNEIRDPVSGILKKRVIFRKGRPDDYMSHLAGRNSPDSEALEYIPHDPESSNFKEWMKFLKKICPQPDMLAYYVRLMASCLEGNNREQCYYTFIGVGGNGKSKVIDLMRYTLGDYCSSLSSAALTRSKPDSGAANPDIIAIKNKRFIYLQEPDDREPLNTSRMKQFSGEDVVEARGLFEDQQRFRITGKLFMMCNRLPPIHAMDRGTWRRIRVLVFGSKFVDSSDPDLKTGRANVFLRDNGLDAKLREWREAWLGLLVHIYEKEYLVNGLEPIPQVVLEESNKYKESFDQYGKFKAERIVDFRDVRANLQEYGNEQVSLKDVMVAYTSWVKQNEGALTGKKLTKQELQNRLEEDFGSLENGVFRRCAVFFDDDGKAEFHRERAPEEEAKA